MPPEDDVERYALDAMILRRCRRPLGHEMKNAVQGLYSGTEILAKVIEPGSRSKVSPAECVALLRRQLDSLQQRLAHILDDIAPEESASEMLDVSALIHDVARFLMSDAAVANVKIQLVEMPPQAMALASAARIRRLVLGFFLDAIDAMRGAGTLSVRIRANPETTTIELLDTRGAMTPEQTAVARQVVPISGALLHSVASRTLAAAGGAFRHEVSPVGSTAYLLLRTAPTPAA